MPPSSALNPGSCTLVPVPFGKDISIVFSILNFLSETPICRHRKRVVYAEMLPRPIVKNRLRLNKLARPVDDFKAAQEAKLDDPNRTPCRLLRDKVGYFTSIYGCRYLSSGAW